MAKRIEQSHRHGYQDPRSSFPLHVVGDNTLPPVEPAQPLRIPPTLTLVGGTDVTPPPLDPGTSLRI
jgi:hypothetical protein